MRMQKTKVKYIDMHCDTLTVCGGEENFLSGGGQCSVEKLIKSGCAAQCFAVFTEGDGAYEYFALYDSILKGHGGLLCPVMHYADLSRAEKEGKLGCILTVENLGFLNSPEDIPKLSRLGVKMASLVWNHKNAYAYPNMVFNGGTPRFELRESRGLTALGFKAVHWLDESKIIIDISHLSDGGVRDILTGRKIPVVASHSNCAEVLNVSRNLTDAQLKAVADCGGVIGVNFCKNFVGGEVIDGAVRHILHIIDTAGEDAAALGSDFDGIPAPEGLEDCTKTGALFERLSQKLSPRVLEKVLHGNFLRVFKNVCG